MTIRSLAPALCAAALSWACNQQGNPNTMPPAGAEVQPGQEERGSASAPSCPMDVPGTAVELTEPDGGVAFTFTTDSGDVRELRDSVAQLADRVERRGERRARRSSDLQARGGMRGMVLPPSAASVEPVDHGARMVLTPEDPDDLDELRDSARMHQQHFVTGQCLMGGYGYGS